MNVNGKFIGVGEPFDIQANHRPELGKREIGHEQTQPQQSRFVTG
jgi:hypothetical protein